MFGDGQDGIKNLRQEEQNLMTNSRGSRHYTVVMPDNIHCFDELTYSDGRIKTRKLWSIPSAYGGVVVKALRY